MPNSGVTYVNYHRLLIIVFYYFIYFYAFIHNYIIFYFMSILLFKCNFNMNPEVAIRYVFFYYPCNIQGKLTL